MKKKLIVPVIILIVVVVCVCFPLYKKQHISKGLIENGFSDTYPWYVKYDTSGDIFSYYLPYEIIGHGQIKLLPRSTNIEITYDGRDISYYQFSCELKKNNDYQLPTDASDTCIDNQPSGVDINKLITEYEKVME